MGNTSPLVQLVSIHLAIISLINLQHNCFHAHTHIHLLRAQVGTVQLEIRVCVEPTSEWGRHPDPGSLQWMLQQALDSSEPRGSGSGSSLRNHLPHDSSALPEDKFHLQFPSDVDQYTGQKLEGQGEGLLPEERFHKKDAHSSFLINQREQAVKDKWDKHAK